MVAEVNSILTLSDPRNRNCLNPRCCFKILNTGSTIDMRFWYGFPPAGLRNFFLLRRCSASRQY